MLLHNPRILGREIRMASEGIMQSSNRGGEAASSKGQISGIVGGEERAALAEAMLGHAKSQLELELQCSNMDGRLLTLMTL